MPIQFRRGLESDLAPTNLLSAEPAFTTDTHKLFIGNGDGAQQMAAVTDVASQVTAHNANTAAHGAQFNTKLDKAGGTVNGNLSVLGNLLVGANGGQSVWTAGTLPVDWKDWNPEVGLHDGTSISSSQHILNDRWGRCMRIGKLVVATFRIRGYFSTAPTSGYAAILGLPYPAVQPGFGYMYANYNYLNNSEMLTMMVMPNTSRILLYGGSGTYAVQWATRSNTTHDGDIAGTVIYYI